MILLGLLVCYRIPELNVVYLGFGPNINIARDPRFGRTSELPGEDPFLSGLYATMMVQGMQEKDSKGHPKMLAYLKHFDAYSRETDRGHDNYNISMFDLFDTYLRQYKMAFMVGQATGAMCSYNAINGIPSCANGFLLNEVIREMWNRSDAHITTDCSAVSNTMGAPLFAPTPVDAAAWTINNGTDLEMGSSIWATSLPIAAKQGFVSEAKINSSFLRAFTPHFIAGRFDPLDEIEWSKFTMKDVGSKEHQDIQFDAALQSMVLLKNDGTLPLKRNSHIAVLGPIGVSGFSLLDDYYGDDICQGGGFSCITTIGEAISSYNEGGVTIVIKSVDIDSTNATEIPVAIEAAQKADIVILCLGIDKSIEYEGVDRTDTALPGLQESFALSILKLGKPVILILVNGGALAIDNLVNGPSAIIEAYEQ